MFFDGKILTVGLFDTSQNCDRRFSQQGSTELSNFSGPFSRLDLDPMTPSMTAGLLSQLAHDLRTPLSVVMGSLAELEETAPVLPAPERTLMVAMIHRAVARLLTLSDRLALAAGVEHGLTPTLESRDLTRLTCTAVDTFTREHLHPRLKLLTIWPHVPIKARVDSALVGTLLLELLTNANRFALTSVTVEISNGRGISVCVDDDGPGVATDERERLFQPFAVRTHRHGLGMGLWLARALAQLHHGVLTVEPRPGGEGTRQRFWLPSQP
jgi:signal transduction histidine kinase